MASRKNVTAETGQPSRVETATLGTSTVEAREPATTSEVRTWANANGYPCAARGRVSAEILAAFVEATGRELMK